MGVASKRASGGLYFAVPMLDSQLNPLTQFTSASPPAPQVRRRLAIAAAFIVAYVCLDWATYLYAIRPFAITTWNPTAGLALAFLLVFGIRQWPALAVAAFAADSLVRGVPPAHLFFEPLAVAIITSGYVGMAALLRGPLGFRNQFDHLRDMVVLIGIACAGSLVLAIAYVAVYR